MTKTINPFWQDFKYYQDLKPRYSDLDTQLHVNNLAYLEMGEAVRINYYKATGIWDGTISPGGFGMVIASVKVDFINSINHDDTVRVGVKATQIGNKSITFAFVLKSPTDAMVYGRGEVIAVCYDYEAGKTKRVPIDWRRKLADFEDNPSLLT